MQKALLFFTAVLILVVIAYSVKPKEGFTNLMGVEWTSMNEGTPKACYTDLPIKQPKTVNIAEAGVGNIEPSPPPASSLPSAPFAQRSKEVPNPYKDPTNEPAKYIRILQVKEDLQAFFGFEASQLETRSDPAIQIPLNRARADMAELINVQSVMERNPGLPSRINLKQLDDISANLQYLRAIHRDLVSSGAIQQTALEGFADMNSGSALKTLQDLQVKLVLLRERVKSGIEPTRLSLATLFDLDTLTQELDQRASAFQKSNLQSIPVNDAMNEFFKALNSKLTTLGVKALPSYKLGDSVTMNDLKMWMAGLVAAKESVNKNSVSPTSLQKYLDTTVNYTIQTLDAAILNQQTTSQPLSPELQQVLTTGQKLLDMVAPEISKDIEQNKLNSPPINQYNPTAQPNSRKPATFQQLKDFQLKVVVEMQRLSASGTNDPIITARLNVLQKIKQDVDSVIEKLQSGELTAATVPIYAADIERSFPILGNPSAPLPTLLQKADLPPQLSSLFPGGLSPRDTDQMAQINNIIAGYGKKFIDGASWQVSLKYENPDIEKIRLQTAEKNERLMQMATKMGAVKQSQGGLPGVAPSGKAPLQAQDAKAASRAPADMRRSETSAEYENGLPGSSTSRILPGAPPAKLDWKQRNKEITEQIKRRGLDPLTFGGLPNDAEVSDSFSWRGHTQMMCSRLNQTTDPGLAVSVGCPPLNWEGWRT